MSDVSVLSELFGFVDFYRIYKIREKGGWAKEMLNFFTKDPYMYTYVRTVCCLTEILLRVSYFSFSRRVRLVRTAKIRNSKAFFSV